MESGNGVKVSGRAPVKLVAHPKNYYEYASLDLHYRDKNNYSIDDQGEAKYGKKANAPLNYVTDLQADLITLNYLNGGSADGAYGGKTERAVRRFQHHAGRVCRMPGKLRLAKSLAALRTSGPQPLATCACSRTLGWCEVSGGDGLVFTLSTRRG